MALPRYTVPVDGTIPIQALVYTNEQLLATQEGVGIYDGPQKSAPHQSGTVSITSHRLFYVDKKAPENDSFALDLAYVTQTDYYAGLFTSSPKITLHLARKGFNMAASDGPLATQDGHNSTGPAIWECDVCGNKNINISDRSPSSTQICVLCGVVRSPATQSTSSHHLSISLPSSSVVSSSSLIHPQPTTSVACPACTFLNHPSLAECEICETRLSVASTDISKLAPKSAPATRISSPDIDDEDGHSVGGKMIKVSFRKGGDKAFYTTLKRSLKSKAWETRATPSYKPDALANSDTDSNTIARSGITGILQSVESSAQGQDIDLKSALQDLEALMIKARDMVQLAAGLNEKLNSVTIDSKIDSNRSSRNSTPVPPSSPSPTLKTGSGSQMALHELPEEAIFIRSSLAQLGLQVSNVPVTSDMIADEKKWVNELARELAEVLRGMMRDRGIVALDEVWGGWNRARGVALLPPSTFLQVIPLLPQYTSPQIQMRKFKSGLSVLHTPSFAQPAFSTRLKAYLTLQGPKTTMEIALMEGITVALAREMMDDAEINGDVVRDDAECVIQDVDPNGGGFASTGFGGVGEAGVKWWPNVFIGYVWDGQKFDAE